MTYRVELSERAVRDLKIIYERIEAQDSRLAQAWFNKLESAILSLDENPGRATAIPEGGVLRHRLFGRRRNVYRIIYSIDEPRRLVVVIHVRHGTRDAFSDKGKA